MKKKLLIVAILLIALALFTRHYSLIEKNDPLPEEVQAFLNGLTGTAHAAEDEQRYIVDEVLRPHAFLEKGDSGETVKALQEKLYDLGFSNDTADGIFGEQTEGAFLNKILTVAAGEEKGSCASPDKAQIPPCQSFLRFPVP